MFRDLNPGWSAPKGLHAFFKDYLMSLIDTDRKMNLQGSEYLLLVSSNENSPQHRSSF